MSEDIVFEYDARRGGAIGYRENERRILEIGEESRGVREFGDEVVGKRGHAGDAIACSSGKENGRGDPCVAAFGGPDGEREETCFPD